MFLSQNRGARSNTAHQRQHQLRQGSQGQGKAGATGCVDVAHGIGAQTNAARGAADQVNHAFAGQGLQVFLGRVGRLETKGAGDLGPCWRCACACNGGLDQVQNLLLAGGELGVV